MYSVIFSFVFLCAIPARAQAQNKIVYGITSRVQSLDPYTLSGIDSYTVTGFTLEPLLRIDPVQQTLRPWLAQSWKIDAKKKSVTVTLQKGVEFHDSQTLTSEDVRATWHAFNDSHFKGDIWRPMWEDVAEIKVIDNRNFEIQFKKLSYQSFLNVMTALRILPRSMTSKERYKGQPSQLVGTGPFRLTKFQQGKSLTFEPNPKWWGRQVLNLKPASGILVKSVGDAKLAKQLWLKRQLDIFALPPDEAIYDNSAVAMDSPFANGFSLELNMRVKALADHRVRKALLLLWNRAALNEKVYHGKMQLALDNFDATNSFYPPSKPIGYDLNAAIRLLNQAGYNPQNPLKLKLLSANDSERWVGLYQSDAAKAGVQITIETIVDENQTWKVMHEGKFELAASNGALADQPNSSVWHSQGFYNNGGVKDEKLDRLLETLDLEFDSQKRASLIKQAILRIREIQAEIPGLSTSKAYYYLSNDTALNPNYPLEAWHWSKSPIKGKHE